MGADEERERLVAKLRNDPAAMQEYRDKITKLRALCEALDECNDWTEYPEAAARVLATLEPPETVN